MDCSEFRRRFADFDSGVGSDAIDGEARAEWAEHFHVCSACGDWGLAQRVMAWGHDPANHPCVHMAYHAMKTCPQHAERDECPDLVVEHDPRRGGYFLIKPGVRLLIAFCPWCGTKLPGPNDP